MRPRKVLLSIFREDCANQMRPEERMTEEYLMQSCQLIRNWLRSKRRLPRQNPILLPQNLHSAHKVLKGPSWYEPKPFLGARFCTRAVKRCSQMRWCENCCFTWSSWVWMTTILVGRGHCLIVLCTETGRCESQCPLYCVRLISCTKSLQTQT
jgi:hypothetical protein